MLRQTNGRYVCVAEEKQRYDLGKVKQTLMGAVGLDTDKKGSAAAFFRSGYKVKLTHKLAWRFVCILCKVSAVLCNVNDCARCLRDCLLFAREQHCQEYTFAPAQTKDILLVA